MTQDRPTARELVQAVREFLEHDVVTTSTDKRVQFHARVAANVFCLGETVAVPLFKELRAACTVAPAKRALDRILRDEVRHRDFGWTLLGWLFESPLAPALRRTVESELPDYFDRLRRSYAPASASTISITPADASWGLMPPTKYADCVRRTLERDWVPRFGKLGIDARAAWSARA